MTLIVSAVRGALGFLTRLPTGRDRRAWDAFRATPAAFPLAGWVVGALVSVAFLLGLPAPTAAFAYLLAVYAVTGINHADGVADLGDAAVVHGDSADRRAVMKDTDAGVGAVLALALVVAGLALAGLALARVRPLAAVAVVVAAEVGAKLGMAGLACLGDPAHEGLGSGFTDNGPTALLAAAAVAAPVLLFGWVGAAALAGALVASLAVLGWTRRALGGVSGDAFGATNELARLAGLHAGVVALDAGLRVGLTNGLLSEVLAWTRF
ncbi:MULTISPECIES: adenosylcobinamide-GDP ribazoletransferase [Halorussus]|uniref:adenosylcobinamide-GDP ribazoletransferase n=1 Tax=Halorussus TaxID=1070314 RepID=UPI0020A0F497|nr:adenosylcobinamide-GDP ribazoletransferase [Halorussus vallis]USZ75046.1 adenosylcobinamide-GDP ribazoletransferase [Halorussus vallis]